MFPQSQADCLFVSSVLASKPTSVAINSEEARVRSFSLEYFPLLYACWPTRALHLSQFALQSAQILFHQTHMLPTAPCKRERWCDRHLVLGTTASPNQPPVGISCLERGVCFFTLAFYCNFFIFTLKCPFSSLNQSRSKLILKLQI